MRLHRRIPQLFGYDLINIRRNHPSLQSHLQEIFKLLEINSVIDVGGNTGQYGTMLRKMGYKGDIFSFEPVQASFNELEKCCSADSKWSAFNYALGAEETEMKINVTNASAFASFYKPNEYAKELRAKEVPVKSTETVKIRKLDDVFPEMIAANKQPNIFLKMDTQGYDLQVLQGAAEVIKQIIALQSEISILPLYEGMPDYVEAITRYRDAGFELTGFYPVTRDYETMLLVELDCVMRRIT